MIPWLKRMGRDYPLRALSLCLHSCRFFSWAIVWRGGLLLPGKLAHCLLWNQTGRAGRFCWWAVCLFLGEVEGWWHLLQWTISLWWCVKVNVWNVTHPPVWFLADWVFPLCLALVSTIQISHSSIHAQTKTNQSPLQNLSFQPFRIWAIWKVCFPYLWGIGGFACAAPWSHQFKIQKSAPFF